MDDDATGSSTPSELLTLRFQTTGRRYERRSLTFGAIAILTTLAAPVVGGIAIRHQGVSLRAGVSIAGLYLVGSIPLWWQSNCYRRSANEHRRLELHTLLVEPYLAGFEGQTATIMRAALAQKLFVRDVDDNDILREATWPTPDQLRADVSESIAPNAPPNDVAN